MPARLLRNRFAAAILTCGVAGTAGATLIAGCGSSSPGALPGTVVNVSQRDFRMVTGDSSVPAGRTTFRVSNHGPDQHELIMVRADSAGALPLRTDGYTVDEDAVKHAEPGALEPGAPGATRLLTVNLTPGRYILFCNMAGHFMAGMHTVLTVRR